MQFYRHLAPIKAMTFDLDDTLYDNRPVIRQVEASMAAWLHKYHPISATQPHRWWNQIKRQVAREDDWLLNDVTLWRHRQIEHGLSLLGYEDDQAKRAADDAIEEVLRLRSDFTVPDEAHRVLTLLAERLPLVAITNGNVDVERIGLDGYFSLVLKAGPNGYAKPHPDLFQKAAQHLALPAESILHVGDHLVTDVLGAKNSGFSACWFNGDQQTLFDHPKTKVLPDAEVSQLADLLRLIER